MAEKFEWIKLILTNWKTLAAIFTFLASWGGWQTLAVWDRDKEIIETRQQVATVANHYVKTVMVTKPAEKAECTTVCTKLIRLHKTKDH